MNTQHAFKQMLADNDGRIRYIADRYGGASDRDDMYQEILLQLWRSYESFSGHSSIGTWVYKVALNTANTFVKTRIKHNDIKQSVSRHSKQQPHAEQAGCQADILNQFMDKLSDIDAGVLMMYLDGLKSEDIAQVLGISDNAVRSRIKRIKREFEQNFVGDES
ncbi:RNA polymerase sigma factor [Pseudoalteromonas rubra]|uniref:RNA polymerase subunit sigma n=1 Tax=Pseudoalteromonas rubra TaxID=43658 RepID=A0A0U3HUS8_9GAMM|nr:RNA polymerase sigma factor [Pseudoalteromonas rubra]ALU45241.1 RNA polymerase subunit sigma [Pseudoalteromonas rubra]